MELTIKALTRYSFTCKRRHTRCDEKKPTCGNCARLDLSCERKDTTWTVDQAAPAAETSVQATQSQQDAAPVPHPEVPSSTLDIFRSHLDGLDQLMEFTPPELFDPATAASLTPPATVNSSSSSERPLLNSESAFLLQTYVKTVATWMDLFDHSCTYVGRLLHLPSRRLSIC